MEIARITIASTTQDVTSVYARQVGQRIQYRVVDEYNGDTPELRAPFTGVRSNFTCTNHRPALH